jgi:SAM-dependent methyltransferase
MRRHSLPIRALFRLAQSLERLGRALHWAIVGSLTREDLDSMSADAWKTFGRDEAFVASGLLAWESAAYGEFIRRTDRILLIGSGSGRDLLALRQAGHEVVGVEQSPAPTAQAHALLARHGLTASIVEARFEQAAIPGAFDAIVFSWFSYCHILGTDARVAALRKALAHLAPDGRVLVPYVTIDPPLARRGIEVARAAGWLTRSDWRAEPADAFYASTEREPVYTYQHSFAKGDVEAEAARAGAEVLAVRRFPDASIAVLTARRSAAPLPRA